MKLRQFLLLLLLGVSLASSASPKMFEPMWRDDDVVCPAPSAQDRYIEVPVFHDLAAMARVDRIPGLNLFTDKQEKFVNRKMRIYYELFGPWDAHKPLLILIPGGPGQPHADMHRIVEMMAEDTALMRKFNIIAMDHRGVGCSRPMFPGNEPEESMMMRQAASDIEMIRKELVGPEGGIHVWGYSYGSILAQTYALLYPDHLDKLFLGGSVSNLDDFHLAGVQFESFIFSAVKHETRAQFEKIASEDAILRDTFYKWAFGQLYTYRGRVVEIPLKTEALVAAVGAGHREDILKELTSPPDSAPSWMMRSIACLELFPTGTKFSGEFPMWPMVLGICEEFKGRNEFFNYLPLLPQISARTMIYGGAFDHVTPAQAMTRMAHQIPNSFLYIDNFLGHGLKGKTTCFFKLMEAFLTGASDAELTELTYAPICQVSPRVNEGL